MAAIDAANQPVHSAPDRSDSIRVDLQLMASMIEPGTRVLDVGCGDGALLDHLVNHKQVDGRGIELSQSGVNACLRRGLSVIQGNADTDLEDYPSQAFDYVVLSQTLQATYNPFWVLNEMIRIGRYAIVSFPNFGSLQNRLQLLTRGRMPVTRTLPMPWYETPNIHFCTITDFIDLCRRESITVVRRHALKQTGSVCPDFGSDFMANLLGSQGLFLLTRGPNAST